MSARESFEFPKDMKSAKGARTQIGALCCRVTRGKTQVLLVTSRTRRRWIVPKGCPMREMTPSQAATVEAREEAGVRGKAEDHVIGYFPYDKLDESGRTSQPCVVCVFPLKVKSLAKVFPERHQRRRKWMSPKQASKKVAEPELRELLRDFTPPRRR